MNVCDSGLEPALHRKLAIMSKTHVGAQRVFCVLLSPCLNKKTIVIRIIDRLFG